MIRNSLLSLAALTALLWVSADDAQAGRVRVRVRRGVRVVRTVKPVVKTVVVKPAWRWVRHVRQDGTVYWTRVYVR